ncbi:VirB6/TrbL-like conjugal transfer protein, CD1112 family, partial [[Clostridium] symbiosum]|uniref:VirB6/TrbL-like conjugal transfer protein, CD1112 family n=1 Tax=Clostridium symbiosum TaxID=1512 RepID=UPI001FA9C8F4
MGSLFDWITDWIKEGMIEAITGQYTSIFESVNNQVTDVAAQVGQTPQGWNGGVFNMIRSLSDNVVVPIAGMILTFVLVYELIQMILEKNNMHDFDTFNIFKWIFKTFVATYLLTNCFTIVMAVFDLAQNVVSRSAGIINGSLNVNAALADLQTQLEAMGVWELIGLWLETNIIHLCMWILSIVIFVIVYGRMIEIYRASRSAAFHPKAVRGHFGNPALASR